MNHKIFQAAMYLRLSRDDADVGKTAKWGEDVKSESNSIGNQRELIRAFIHEQKDIELYDIYIDDGFSGSNFERPEFKRMINDVEAGKVNCVIVKDLSRFGRDYIESGRYIQKVFPILGVRFIAITDHFDSLKADTGESNIVLPVKNFINDSYCRDISMKVKSQIEIKQKNGECISAFAPYGYKKSENNKGQLVIDEYASEIVKKIFHWKMEGLAAAAIADKLNELGILSPKEYKKTNGMKFCTGFSGKEKSVWSGVTVKRILTNEIYIGHMVQGKTQKINYKIKKRIDKPEEEWIRVENTHEEIISEEVFLIVQNLLKIDSRVSPKLGKNSLFSALLFCGDCHEQMTRRTTCYKNKEKIYFICSSKNRGEGCTRHSITEETLKELVMEPIRAYANCFLEEKKLLDKAMQLETNFESIVHYDKEIERLRKEQDKYYSLCSALHDDLRKGVITKEEFERMYVEFKGKAEDYENAQKKQEKLIKDLFKQGIISAGRLKTMQDAAELKEIDRYTLCSMVRKIYVYENQRIEIEFNFQNQFDLLKNINSGICLDKILKERSA